ncbi:Type III restriction enzyme, res subunit [Halpernia humi]|uniref:Type III restriction enzyme, res subunit n=1 Tax=Halpernia humi TaxID=493375 RepID=A0A1H5Y846_9FLAO|nr:DEAD/DEAH box helicase family protein [Halpernia humi]SEG20193.1 Type III restriction enzyme, res subunit [Halpernia humi]
MNQFPENIHFKFSWRKYQKELLEGLDFHLKNDHFHIIAPPGSGKTVLGLEVMLKINKPTLIFVPTISIKTQWISRFCKLFLNTDIVPAWISNDIKNPQFLTVVTYQSFNSATKSDEDFKEILNKIKTKNIQCLVFDEAHHLKREWWKSLMKIKEKLSCKIIALTATPPYDVEYAEWKNYIALNWPIDAEIYVPDLVLEKNLCPHQDFVHYSFPSSEEFDAIETQKEKSDKIFLEIKNDQILVQELKKLPFFLDPVKFESDIYENIGFYSSVLIFLNEHKIKISKKHFEIIGTETKIIPPFNRDWAETLLNFILFEGGKYFFDLKEYKENLYNKLIRNGLVENNSISFGRNENINSQLINSISKLNSISEIVDFEYNNLGNNLRMVILTDYIRKEYLSISSENDIELMRIGVMSIFEKIRRKNFKKKKIAVLTGSVIILPIECKKLFLDKIKNYNINVPEIFLLSFDENYFQFQQDKILNNKIVSLITDIFSEGKIEIIIGTKSLLGEGWDAPCINSLILASFIGSFVLSNQMRGRAIRSEFGNPEKTSNIWHLVCLNPVDENFGEDFKVMKRRFKSFVGIDYSKSPHIQNSFERIKPKMNLFNYSDIQRTNLSTFKIASERKFLCKKWDFAISKGSGLIEEIKIPFPERESFMRTKKFYYDKTLQRTVLTLISGVLGFGGQSLVSILSRLKNIHSLYELGTFVSLFGFVGLFIFGGYTFKTFKIFLRYKNISKDFLKIGTVLLESLQFEGSIKKNKNIVVESKSDKDGIVICCLKNASTQENGIFLNALKEIVSPIEKPRYLIVREEKFLFFLMKQDYNPLPDILAKNKKTAEYFLNQWQQKVGNAKLFYTQNAVGRKMLVKARFNSYSSNFQKKAEIINEWK